MGKSKDGDAIAMVLCIIGLFLLAQQGSLLSTNKKILTSKEKEFVTSAVPSLSKHFCDLTREEITSLLSSSPSPTPILNFLQEALAASLPLISQHLADEIIESTVTHAGFFPSNLMQTLQDLLEYNSGVMAFAVSQLLDGIASSYYYYYQQANYYPYLTEGNIAAFVSQIFGVLATVPPLSQNTQLPVQDSWFGNFLVSLPNITYQTADNSTSWTAGFTSASGFFRNLGNNEWKGSYWSGNNPDQHRVNWDCYGCDGKLNDIANQAAILSQGPSNQKEDLKLRPVGTQ